MTQQRILVGLLVVLGVIPVVSGLTGALLGPTVDDPGGVEARLDSEYRFLSALWFCLGALLWWSLRRPAARAAATRLFLVAAFAGGLARVAATLSHGWPGTLYATAIAVEVLAVPGLYLWHRDRFGVMDAAGARR